MLGPFSMLYIIEHLEPLSKWVKLEYEHCSKIVGKENLLFTNIVNKEEQEFLKRLGKVEEKSVIELFSREEIIVLEPQAKTRLQKDDFKKYKKIIIGGILGEAEPSGRTMELITSKLKKGVQRNLGADQFSIDGATFVAKKIQEGEEKDLGVLKEPEIEFEEGHSTVLHYAIPVFRGKPIFTPGLVEYVQSDESWD